MTARIHHYVSQCYLRGFANAETPRLYVIDGAARRTFETTPRNVAAERDFNRIDAKGLALDALEADIAGFEGELASALERIIKKRSFNDPDDRLVVLNFIGLLAIRNPRHRATFSGFEDRVLKMMAELMVATPERWASQVKEGKEAGIFPADMDLDYETMKAFVRKGDYHFVTPRMISCSHISPEGGVSALVGRHGVMKPAGSERDMAANIDALRQNASRAGGIRAGPARLGASFATPSWPPRFT
jgi:Protein of unknown function (DUF4238)